MQTHQQQVPVEIPQVFHYPLPPPQVTNQIQTINDMMQVLMQRQEKTDNHIAFLVSHHQAAAAAASCAAPPEPVGFPAAGFPAPCSPAEGHGPHTVDSPTGPIPAGQPDEPTPVASPTEVAQGPARRPGQAGGEGEWHGG